MATEKKVIIPADLSDDFAVKSDNKVYIQPNVKTYYLEYQDATTGDNPATPQRRQLTVQNGFGIVHLDFKVSTTSQVTIATLPSDAPVAQALSEVQTHDGGFVYLDARSRKVIGHHLQPNTRYVVDILGYFK